MRIQPAPPAGARWLELSADGRASIRIDLTGDAEACGVTTEPLSGAPGEQLLEYGAQQILVTAADDRFIAGQAADGMGDVVRALEAAGALSPFSPAPGHLATVPHSQPMRPARRPPASPAMPPGAPRAPRHPGPAPVVPAGWREELERVRAERLDTLLLLALGPAFQMLLSGVVAAAWSDGGARARERQAPELTGGWEAEEILARGLVAAFLRARPALACAPPSESGVRGTFLAEPPDLGDGRPAVGRGRCGGGR